MNRIGRSLGFGAVLGSAVGAFAGCGGDDDGGGASRGGSFANIRSAIESPTGTVDATTARDVGVEFEKAVSVDLPAGMRRDAQTAQTQSGTQSCPAGGELSASGSGNESSGDVSVSYDNCCMQAGCCVDGDAHVYYSTEQSAPYLWCGSYDVSYDCEGTSAALTYDGCISSSGEQIYVIEVSGETYSVSGSYANGSGTLEVRGENGSWTCTYTADSGTCTGSTGSFEF